MSFVKITDPAKIIQLVFDDESNVNKIAESGMSLQPIGALGSPVRVGQTRPVLVYNSGASVAFVKFGQQGITAPAGAADGIPVLPNSLFVLNSGSNDWVIASSAAVFGYAASNS